MCVCASVCVWVSKITLPCLYMNEWMRWMAGSCSSVIRSERHRYRRWHFGLRYPPTIPWESYGDGCGSGHMANTPWGLPSASLHLSITELRLTLGRLRTGPSLGWTRYCYAAVSTHHMTCCHEQPDPDELLIPISCSTLQPHPPTLSVFIQSPFWLIALTGGRRKTEKSDCVSCTVASRGRKQLGRYRIN